MCIMILFNFDRLELQRIKFLVNSYLRLRLSKIQKNIFYITKSDEDNPTRMTPEVVKKNNVIFYTIKLFSFLGGRICFKL